MNRSGKEEEGEGDEVELLEGEESKGGRDREGEEMMMLKGSGKEEEGEGDEVESYEGEENKGSRGGGNEGKKEWE